MEDDSHFSDFTAILVQCENATETTITNYITSSEEERNQEFVDYRRELFNRICQNGTDEQFEKLKEAEDAFSIRVSSKFDIYVYASDLESAHLTRNYTAFVDK